MVAGAVQEAGVATRGYAQEACGLIVILSPQVSDEVSKRGMEIIF